MMVVVYVGSIIYDYAVGFTSSPAVGFTSSWFHQLWIELKLPPPRLFFLGYIVCGCVGRGVCVKKGAEKTLHQSTITLY